MILNLLNLLTCLPNHIEISANPCYQKCDYCFAKIWERKYFSAEKIVNEIIREQNKNEGLLSFYLNQKEPIALSNRTDVLCHPEWKDLLKILKQLGFPLYIETKGNKNMMELVDILDKKDEIYFTITSLDNDLYEDNILKNKEKVEMAKNLSAAGVSVIIGINPYMTEKTDVKKSLKMIKYINPFGVVVRHYHAPITNKKFGGVPIKSLYQMKEDKTDRTKKEIIELCKLLQSEGYPIDSDYMIDDLSFYKNEKLILCLKENKEIFNSKSILFHKILNILSKNEKYYTKKGIEIIEFYWDDFTDIFKNIFEYHKDAIIKKENISAKVWRKNNISELPQKIDYLQYIKLLWNSYELFCSSHYYYTDKKDENGNLILFYEYQRG